MYKITFYNESNLKPSLKYCHEFKQIFFETPTNNFDYSLLHINRLNNDQNISKLLKFNDFLVKNSLDTNLNEECIGKFCIGLY